MDTRFWGPSGWQLFHLITFEKGMLSTKKKLFTAMKDVLPCKYCRQSTNEFMREMPIDNNLSFWLYKLHSRVNKKLSDQHAEDSRIIKPAEAPPFEEVVKKYKKEPTSIPGKEFLLSIAYNYDPEIHKQANIDFWEALVKVFPYKFRKNIFMPDLSSQKTYLKDILTMLGEDSSIIKILKKYKSKCKKGKTCRNTRGGNRTLKRIV